MSELILWTILWLQLCTCRFVTPELYTSTYQVRQLASAERELVDTIQAYIDREEARILQLKRFVQGVQRNLTNRIHGSESEGEDPISALLLLKRFEATWSPQMAALRDHSIVRETLGRVQRIVPEFPTMVDVEGAARSVIRVQNTYNLSARQLGRLSLAQYTASDCFQLAETAFQQGYPDAGADWLKEAVYLNDPRPESVRSRERLVNQLLASAEIRFKGVHCGQTGPRHLDKHRGNNGTSQSPDGCTRHGTESDQTEEFHKLCRGDDSRYKPGTSPGYCVYKSSRSYYPWKQEILSRDPYITIFHDVISDFEQQHLINLSKHLLERSAVGQPDNSVTGEARTSKVTWLWDNHTSVIHELSRRVAEITDLCTEFRERGACAEPLQVLNYGIGGQYHSHYDFYQNRDLVKITSPFIRDSGDRLATFMYYLSDVLAGGATVFPELGVRIPPIKGAAAFWYNFKDGRRDRRTKHGGCPVLKGEKWVANKWIHEIAKR